MGTIVLEELVAVPEDANSGLPQNVGVYIYIYTVSYLKRLESLPYAKFYYFTHLICVYTVYSQIQSALVFADFLNKKKVSSRF